MRKKISQSETDGVVYRHAKTWRIALSQLNTGASMCFYILLTYASYLANAGYGILTAVVGIVLTATRILDGITDPLIALAIDKTHTKFGKIRIWLIGGWLLESLAIYLLYVWGSGRGHGIVMFIFLYVIYIIGYTMNNVTGQIIGPVMVNDPKQRPMVGVWSTVYSYVMPMIMTMVIVMGVLPKYGNEYTVDMLAVSCEICIAISFVLVLLACIGVSKADIPENFTGVSASGNGRDRVKVRDMFSLLKSNRPLQMYIIAAASDKLAQQTASQSIVSTMLFGILIGNMQLSTMMSVIVMLPSIVFAIFGAKYAGKHGSKEAIVRWTWVCAAVAVVSVLFCSFADLAQVTVAIIPTIIFFLLMLVLNGAKMCVTTATGAMCADIIDFELERSGKFLPATVTATYSFLDKLISSLGATIATASVALIGYTATMPQPTDSPTAAIKVMTLLLYYGLPLLGWICTLAAMKFSPLSKEKMVEVQKKIQDKKQKDMQEFMASVK